MKNIFTGAIALLLLINVAMVLAYRLDRKLNQEPTARTRTVPILFEVDLMDGHRPLGPRGRHLRTILPIDGKEPRIH